MARELRVEIVGDASSLQRSFGQAEAATGGFGSKLRGVARTAAITAGAAGIGALVIGLKSSVSAAMDAERSQKQMEQALQSVGKSYADHASAIDRAVQSTSKLAAIDDEELQGSFTKLVRTTGNVKQSLEGMSLAADIARARNISLEAATKFVEKALNGNETAFKRVGVEVEKGAGGLAAFEAAQRRFAGSAEAYGNTAAGAQERLGVAVENLQEKLGSALLPILTTVTEKFVVFAGFLEKNPEIVYAAAAALGALAVAFAAVAIASSPITLTILAVAALAAGLAIAYRQSETFRNIINSTADVLKTIFAVALQVATVYINVWKAAIDLARSAVTVLHNAAESVAAFFQGAWAVAVGIAKTAAAVFDTTLDALRAAVNAVKAAFNAVADFFQGAWKTAVNAAKTVLGPLESALDAIASVLNTIASAARNAADAIRSIPHPSLGGVLGRLNPFDYGGGRAGGGRVTQGTAYVVGERGPELFVPGAGGTIIPNGSGGGGWSIVVNNYAPISSEKDFEDMVRGALGRVTSRQGYS